jgi:hypothetical protein
VRNEPPLPAAILPEYLAMVNQVSGELVAVATTFRPKLTPES